MKPHFPISAHVKVSKFDIVYRLAINISNSCKSPVIATKILKWLFTVLLSVVPLHATTIIAISTRNEVLLGLDSKFIIRRGDEIVNTVYGCKITTRGNMAYGLAGWAGTALKPINLANLIGYVQTGEATMNSLQKSLSVRLSEGIYRHEFTERDIATYLKMGETITYVFGIEINGGVPVIRHLQFQLNRDRSIRPELGVERIPSVFYLKKNESVRRATPQDWIGTTDLNALLRSLMAIGINADDVESGGLISIVRIDAKQGLQWIEFGACATDNRKK